jgi:ribosomal protein L7/L12
VQALTPDTLRLMALVVFGGILLLSIGLAGVAARLAAVRNRTAALSRIEAKLDLLLKQANIKFDPYADLPAEVAAAVRAGQTINAIKLYRQSSGAGLKEAKEFIEEIQRRSGVR